MKVLLAEEERNEEDIEQDELALGATAAKGKEERELSGEGSASDDDDDDAYTATAAAADTSDLVDEDMNKEDDGVNGDQNEPILEHAEGESFQSAPRQVPRRRLRHRFTQWQLEELESIFQTNCILSVEAR